MFWFCYFGQVFRDFKAVEGLYLMLSLLLWVFMFVGFGVCLIMVVFCWVRCLGGWCDLNFLCSWAIVMLNCYLCACIFGFGCDLVVWLACLLCRVTGKYCVSFKDCFFLCWLFWVLTLSALVAAYYVYCCCVWG